MVGSERTCDDVELFRSIEFQEQTMAVVVNTTLTKEVDWESRNEVRGNRPRALD